MTHPTKITELSLWISEIPEGLSRHVTTVGEGIWILRQGMRFFAYQDRCRHQGGSFQPAKHFTTGFVTCLRCPHHGWLLNAETGEYQNPSGHLTQDTLCLRLTEDGRLLIQKPVEDRPWAKTASTLTQENITAGADMFHLTHYSHACVRVQLDDFVCFTDPWLTGPAFTRGWWLTQSPPDTWLEDLAQADAIVISHSHSDHLHLATLEKLAAMNPEVPVWLPNYGSPTCERLVRQSGMRHIQLFPFFEWITCGQSVGRLMFLPDESGREDSGMLFSYKECLVLNTVDCPNLNGGKLPSPVDVLLTGFAGGASGYPVCWAKQYGEAETRRQILKNRQLLLQSAAQLIAKTKPKVVVPFAGYFTEAYPADAWIQSINRKNSTSDFAAMVANTFPQVQTWSPQPGDRLSYEKNPDGKAFKVFQKQALSTTVPVPYDQHDFQQIDHYLATALTFEPFQHLSGWQQYFTWVAYQGPLILHVLETDLSFEKVINEFWVNFCTGGAVSRTPMNEWCAGAVSYQQLWVRADAFRHVCRWGLSWEEFSIGFQARFYRKPDVYQFEFWNHVQNHLPASLPFETH